MHNIKLIKFEAKQNFFDPGYFIEIDGGKHGVAKVRNGKLAICSSRSSVTTG